VLRHGFESTSGDLYKNKIRNSNVNNHYQNYRKPCADINMIGFSAKKGSKEYWNTLIKVVIVHYRRQNMEGDI
jgi:hypothetical protein